MPETGPARRVAPDCPQPSCAACWQLEHPQGEPFLLVVRRDGDGMRLHVCRSPEALPRRAAFDAILRGLAHDFGNALASIMGFAEIARTRPVADPLLSRSLDNILKGCAQARERLDWARIAAGRAEPQSATGDLAACVDAWCTGLARDHARGPNLTWDVRGSVGGTSATPEVDGRLRVGEGMTLPYDVEVPSVLFDAALLHGAFVALVENAIDAAGPEGSVRVSIVPDGALARRQPGWTCIVVSDDGPGMTPARLLRYGEAYLHASDGSEGKGRGAAYARGILRSHGGGLEIASRQGSGTVACMLLPPSGQGTGWLVPPVAVVGSMSVGSEEDAWPLC